MTTCFAVTRSEVTSLGSTGFPGESDVPQAAKTIARVVAEPRTVAKPIIAFT